MENKNDIIKYFKIRLIKSGLTQKELANKIDVSYVTINKWINGKNKNLFKFIYLLKILNINLDDINIDSLKN